MSVINSFLGGGVVAAALLFIQFLINRHDDRDRDILCIKKKLEQIEAFQLEAKASTARTNILRFADELYNNIHHSKEYFDQILTDIDEYNAYCSNHPNYKNSKAEHATEIVKETYKQLYKEHKL